MAVIDRHNAARIFACELVDCCTCSVVGAVVSNKDGYGTVILPQRGQYLLTDITRAVPAGQGNSDARTFFTKCIRVLDHKAAIASRTLQLQ